MFLESGVGVDTWNRFIILASHMQLYRIRWPAVCLMLMTQICGSRLLEVQLARLELCIYFEIIVGVVAFRRRSKRCGHVGYLDGLSTIKWNGIPLALSFALNNTTSSSHHGKSIHDLSNPPYIIIDRSRNLIHDELLRPEMN